MTSQIINDIGALDERSREIFRHVVESYLETGAPVGSRFLSQNMPLALSAASVRNVMSDLEQLGLLFAPHTSAGRLPTEQGLRLFVDGMLEVGGLADTERQVIEERVAGNHQGIDELLTEASTVLSGLSHCAGLVSVSKADATLKHVEFVALGPGSALVVLVSDNGTVENRIVDVPVGLPPAALTQAGNYLNSRIQGRSLDEVQKLVSAELEQKRSELDEVAQRVVESGLATWSGEAGDELSTRSLIVRGRANLLEDLNAVDDLERIRMLFQDLESKNDLLELLTLTDEAEGVRIFIGSENKLFSLSGSSLIVAPYADEQSNVVGVLGVIGPTRVNYARIIPVVDYTARLVGQILSAK